MTLGITPEISSSEHTSTLLAWRPGSVVQYGAALALVIQCGLTQRSLGRGLVIQQRNRPRILSTSILLSVVARDTLLLSCKITWAMMRIGQWAMVWSNCEVWWGWLILILTGQKTPRGISAYSFLGSTSTNVSAWKLTGNLGGESVSTFQFFACEVGLH